VVRHTRQGRQLRPAGIGKGLLRDHAVAPFSLGLLQRLVGRLDRSVRAASCKALLDGLAYVAFAADPMTRAERAVAAKSATAAEFTDKQQAFVDFVLAKYVRQGLDELDAEKLSPLLKLKYNNAIAGAFAELGNP